MNAPEAVETTDAAAQVEAAKEAVKDAATAVIDETWSKYTNAALGFSFDWPTKGMYAPRWEVKFLNDADVKDGCYGTERTLLVRKQLAGRDFCHAVGPDEGPLATDYYVTRVASRNVMLVFTKDSTGLGDKFSWEEYRTHLDQIVGTFKLKE